MCNLKPADRDYGAINMKNFRDKDMHERMQWLEQEIRILKSEITEKKQLEEQLLQAQKMEALANLAGGIAHDFNNILQSILGYSQLALMGKTPDAPDYKNLIQIGDIIKRGSKLSAQLLTFGRKIPSEFKPLDLNNKIKEIQNLLRRTIPRMIEMELILAHDLRMVSADAGQIDQILMNLSINARDAMPDGGKLVFKTEIIALRDDQFLTRFGAQDSEYVLLSVSDTGSGMSQETAKQIFQPFFTTKEKGKGTGLGLSMVYAIVKNHRGFIDCSTEAGEGTTFKIYFPVVSSDLAQSDIARSEGEEGILAGDETILLVDDEADILEVDKRMLQQYGYTVTTARNGEEAVYKYSNSPIDLVILDVGMPGMGGIKCLQELLSVDQKAKVLISTGYSLNGRVSEALELGAKSSLAKPYSIKELLRTVRDVLDYR